MSPTWASWVHARPSCTRHWRCGNRGSQPTRSCQAGARATALVDGEARELLVRHRPRLVAELEWLADPDPPAQLSPVHGDYHIGQILKSAGGALAVVDLEGE